MPLERFRVTFLPDGADAWVEAGATLLEAAAAANVVLDAPCGDRGICGKCKVRANPAPAGTSASHPILGPPTLQERALIPPEEQREGWRLACQAKVAGHLTVRVPERALQPAMVPLSRVPLQPAVRKLHLRLPKPDIEDPASDLSRLRRALPPDLAAFRIDLPLLRQACRLMDASGYDVTPVFVGDLLIALEQGDTTATSLGLAVDLGTTSVVAMLVDLTTGRTLGVESRLNGQVNYGADVISRITHASEHPDGLRALQAAAAATINSALGALVGRANVDPRTIYEVVVVGNTCMNHLLLGIDPRSLALAPYQPVVADPVACRAADLGIEVHPEGMVYTLPNIAGFVGSDTVSVVLATAMHKSKDIRLAIDLGTNGEIVLGNRDRLLTCSTAAGPAFEGARISCGMRATAGAIERVWIADGQVRLQVIGGGRAIGVCGSGLLDAAAQMVGAGLLDASGRLAAPDGAAGLPAGVASRFVRRDGAGGFVLARRGNRSIVLTQGDVRELQLAKGAIRAGVSTLLKEYGIEAEDVSEILLAGAFGSFLSPASARALGLVPPLPIERITAVGNAAGQGAVMALLSTACREEAIQIARRVEYLELSARPDFMDQFVDALALQ